METSLVGVPLHEREDFRVGEDVIAKDLIGNAFSGVVFVVVRAFERGVGGIVGDSHGTLHRASTAGVRGYSLERGAGGRLHTGPEGV